MRSPALVRAAARTALLYWCVLSLTFVLLRLAPGDPATFLLPPDASAADAVRLRAELGLDRPVAAQYARWAGRDAARRSRNKFRGGTTCRRSARDALPVSLALGGASLLLSFLVGTMRRASCRRAARDVHRFPLTVISVVLAASPAYWLGLGAIACSHTSRRR